MRQPHDNEETQSDPLGARSIPPQSFRIPGDVFENQFGGDVDLLAEVATIFLDDCANHLERIGAAITSADPIALYKTAHALCGSLLNFGAADAARVARKLETMGREGSTQGATLVLADLKREVSRVTAGLTAFVEATSAKVAVG